MNILRTSLLSLALAPAALGAATGKTPAPAFDSSISVPMACRALAGSSADIGSSISHSVAGDSNATFTTALIDRIKVKATANAKGTPNIRPIRIKGRDKYVMFLHPYQVYQLRQSAQNGQWADIQKAAMQGGETSDNALYTGGAPDVAGHLSSILAAPWRASRCAIDGAGAQGRNGVVGAVQGERHHMGRDRVLCDQREEEFAVFAGQVGHRADAALAPEQAVRE